MSGPQNLKAKRFTGKEICDIIKAGADNKLISLEYQGLKLQFRESATVPESENPSKPERVIFPPPPPGAAEEIEDIAKVQARSEDINEEIENLHISDPYEYEQLLARRELENAEENDAGETQ